MDGGLVHIRALEDGDHDALLALNSRVSDLSLYRRFFCLNRHTADTYVDQLLRPPGADHQVLVGLINGQLVGVASYERLDAESGEIALLIEDFLRRPVPRASPWSSASSSKRPTRLWLRLMIVSAPRTPRVFDRCLHRDRWP